MSASGAGGDGVCVCVCMCVCVCVCVRACRESGILEENIQSAVTIYRAMKMLAANILKHLRGVNIV